MITVRDFSLAGESKKFLQYGITPPYRDKKLTNNLENVEQKSYR